MAREKRTAGLRDQLRIFGPAVLVAVIALVVAYQFVDPAPPDRITIATGQAGSAYHTFGLRYREILARDGIELDVLNTDGSVENLELLESPESGVDVAFMQGGVGGFASGGTIVSLASLYYEPLWIFHPAGMTIERPRDLVGKRVSLGPEGSGTRALVRLLMADSGVEEADVQTRDLTDEEAIDALVAGELDVLFMIASPESSHVRRGFELEGVVMAPFTRAEAYTRIHKFLSRLVLPEGAIDLEANLPAENLVMIAPTATLVATEDLHPALVDLLLLAAEEVHRPGGLFERAGQFPSPEHVDFPLSKDARRFFESGLPFLRRTLPFWAATLLDRLKVMLVPLIALIFPLMRVMPNLYRWRMRSRVYRWYKELRVLEAAIGPETSEERKRDLLGQLDQIESDVRKVSIPWSYAEDLYHLRLHIQYVRDQITGPEAEPGGSAPPR